MRLQRRSFLRTALTTALASGCAWGGLGTAHALARLGSSAAGSDYRALVCVFLYGGNDSINTVVPHDGTGYAIYSATRPEISLPRAAVEALTLDALPSSGGLPGGLPDDGFRYGLHPSMSPMATLFNTGKLAVVANVGPLLGPITRPQFQAGSVPVPPQLFSHFDQANFWESSDVAQQFGWGGRIADLLRLQNPNPSLPMLMSLDAQSLYARGEVVNQYVLGSGQVRGIDYLESPDNSLGAQTYLGLMAAGAQSHPFERDYATIHRRSISISAVLRQYLSAPPAWSVPFPATAFGARLRQVANVIRFRGVEALNMRRQIFFIGLGGFDTHSDQLQTQAGLLQTLSAGLAAFHAATEELGISEQVTTFTASDFGRTLTSNGDGTDHGWGGHHFVLGGAVRGRRFYGRMPSLQADDNPDDTGFSQTIPTTSTDQYVATLAAWFGVPAASLGTLLPNLGLCPTANLGFMATPP
jgi:uncharacterized protein (DUF1501 family)